MHVAVFRLEQNSQTGRLDGSSLTSRLDQEQGVGRCFGLGNRAVCRHVFWHYPGHPDDRDEDPKDETQAACCR